MTHTQPSLIACHVWYYITYYVNTLLHLSLSLLYMQSSVPAAVTAGTARVEGGGAPTPSGQLPQDTPGPHLQASPREDRKVKGHFWYLLSLKHLFASSST